MTITLIRYPDSLTPPAPWQPEWEAGVCLRLPSIPRQRVARALGGTPVPSGATPYAEPIVTDALRQSARADLQRTIDDGDRLYAEIARHALDDPARLDLDIAAWLGVVHPFALYAPLGVATLHAACDAHVRAEGLWCSPCSSVVIRTAARGYQVWIGVGGMMQSAGHADDYTSAEALGVESVRAHRGQVMAEANAILAGWAGETPYYSATLATATEALPIQMRRGPMTADELVRGPCGAATSWDLPVVATYVGGAVERHDALVTWDDGQSRELQRARMRAGDAHRAAVVAQAIALFRACPATAPYVSRYGLQGGADLTLRNGMTVHLLGPVTMREDRRAALALVRDHHGRRYHMALAEFA